MLYRRFSLSVLVCLVTVLVVLPSTGVAVPGPDSLALVDRNGLLSLDSDDLSAEAMADAGLVVSASGFIPYEDIGARLADIASRSDRMQFSVMGMSAGNRPLYFVVVAAPDTLARLGEYRATRELLGTDPVAAEQAAAALSPYKLPFYIEGSIHGNEYPGVDASLALIETLATSTDSAVLSILENVVFLVNPVANPDGRVQGTRGNANGFDLNRDLITLSQPESRAIVNVIRDWKPAVVLDLHGFSKQMLIEPCTPPHNPSYEYDLYIKWALPQAQAMEASLVAHTNFHAKIPYIDYRQGWDDWPPIFAPMYAMYHGGLGHTLETPYSDQRGIDAHYWAVWGALTYAAAHRDAMVDDQFLQLQRGFLGSPQQPVPADLLAGSHFPQYLSTFEFPTAFVIPVAAPLQQDAHAAARLVDALLFHGLRVDRATESFSAGGVDYPEGTYVVWTKQPLRGLANTLLYDGWDISYVPGLSMYDISAWSLPLLWGATRQVISGPLTVATEAIDSAAGVSGSVPSGAVAAYAWLPTTNDAIRATNFLLKNGVDLRRAAEPFVDAGVAFGTGTFVLAADQPGASDWADTIATTYGLVVLGLAAVPAIAVPVRAPKIALSADAGLRYVLSDLGFTYDTVGYRNLNAGIGLHGYDVFINSGSWPFWGYLNGAGKQAVMSFFTNGGDYIGVGRSGVDMAVNAKAVKLTYRLGGAYDNGIVRVEYASTDFVAAQYVADGYAYAYGPLWFTAHGPEVHVSASYEVGGFFVAGFWPAHETAAGYPAVVWSSVGASDIVLFGIDPTFRAHTEVTFRLLANALFAG